MIIKKINNNFKNFHVYQDLQVVVPFPWYSSPSFSWISWVLLPFFSLLHQKVFFFCHVDWKYYSKTNERIICITNIHLRNIVLKQLYNMISITNTYLTITVNFT